MDIREGLTLGIDLGIASCGWAVIRETDGGGEIVDWGARTFDVPETDKTRTPTNQLRRQHRGLRKVLRRRRQRMNEIRRLFKEAGLLESDGKSARSHLLSECRQSCHARCRAARARNTGWLGFGKRTRPRSR